MKTKKGFTLIELLVVIAIIAILTGIIIANLVQAKKKSRDSQRVSDIAQIQLGLELFFDKCNAYPATFTTACPSDSTIKLSTFLPKIPTPPINSVETSYAAKYAALNTGCTSYHLGTTLEIPGNSGALKDDLNASAGTVCTGSVADFDGNATGVYDVGPN